VFWIILGLIIKSICQYVLGAEVSTIEKLYLGLGFSSFDPMDLGYIFITSMWVIFKDSCNNLRGIFINYITLKFDSSDDEKSKDEVTKKS
jgi:hypothetical protein